MSKDTGAWMPLYIGDYLGDTQRLTTEQHGAYLLLILDYWRNGPPPDDNGVLQQITKLSPAAWKKHRRVLERMFSVDDGEWHHKRIDRELEAAASNAERRSEKARKAAQARWEQSPDDAPSNAPSMPQAMLGECPPPSPLSTDVDNRGAESRERANRLAEDWQPAPFGSSSISGEIAAKRGPDWNRRALESFRNHWRSANGPNARKRDWQAAWANWVIEQDRRDGNRNGTAPRNGSGSGGSVSGYGRTVDAALDFVREASGGHAR